MKPILLLVVFFISILSLKVKAMGYKVPGFNAYRILPALQAKYFASNGADLQLTRHTSYHEIVLYALDGFYVEVFLTGNRRAFVSETVQSHKKSRRLSSYDRN